MTPERQEGRNAGTMPGTRSPSRSEPPSLSLPHKGGTGPWGAS